MRQYRRQCRNVQMGRFQQFVSEDSPDALLRGTDEQGEVETGSILASSGKGTYCGEYAHD